MSCDSNDPAYRFVQEANRKERDNRQRAAQRRTRAESPKPWFFVATTITMAGFTVMNILADTLFMSAIFGILTAWHLCLAYLHFKRRAEAR